MKLGEYFDSTEFGENLPDQVLQNYHLLCKFALDDLRDRFGTIKITSAYRSPEANAALKDKGYNPSNTSQHVLGEAVDFICPYAPNGMGEVYTWIINDLCWQGEVIYYPKKGHVHLSLPRYNVKMDQFIEER